MQTPSAASLAESYEWSLNDVMDQYKQTVPIKVTIFKAAGNNAWQVTIDGADPPITAQPLSSISNFTIQGSGSPGKTEIEFKPPIIDANPSNKGGAQTEFGGTTRNVTPGGDWAGLIEPNIGTDSYTLPVSFSLTRPSGTNPIGGTTLNLQVTFSKNAGNDEWRVTLGGPDANKVTNLADFQNKTQAECPSPPYIKLNDGGPDVMFTWPNVQTNQVAAVVDLLATNLQTPKLVHQGDDAYTSVLIYDSQGNQHTVEVVFTKTANDNEWQAEATMPDGTKRGPELIQFDEYGQYVSGSMNFHYDPRNGAEVINVAVDFSKITQYSGDKTIIGKGDGYHSGVLETISTDSSGVITGSFSNGQMMILGQVALANFTNPAGLISLGGNLFTVSNNSGEPDIGAAGIGGRGNTKPSSLEMSNVNLADEFTDMIVTQRGFQANSRTITTTDTMLEELINLKR